MSNKRVDGCRPWRPPFGRAAHVPFRSWRNGDGRRPWRPLLLSVLLVVSEVTAAEDEQPSMELLEFLGGWEAKDGATVDPISMLSALLDDAETQSLQTQSEDVKND